LLLITLIFSNSYCDKGLQFVNKEAEDSLLKRRTKKIGKLAMPLVGLAFELYMKMPREENKIRDFVYFSPGLKNLSNLRRTLIFSRPLPGLPSCFDRTQYLAKPFITKPARTA
jgi:hypothetical protein